MRRSSLLLAVLILGPVTSGPVLAQSEPRAAAAGDQALRRAQLMLRQAQEEAAQQQAELKARIQALEADLAKQSQALTAAEGEGAQLRRELAGKSARLDQSQDFSARLKERIESDRQRIEELIGRLKTALTELQTLAVNHEDLQLTLEGRERDILQCWARNEQMYAINRDLLDAYRDKDAWDALTQKEPLFGFSQVKVENTLQEYDYRLEDAQVPTGPE